MVMIFKPALANARRSVLRLTVAALILFGLFATHLLTYFVGRLEGMQNAQHKSVVLANGLYESDLAPEMTRTWSQPSKAMSILVCRMFMEEIN
jgi:hypothetical protein